MSGGRRTPKQRDYNYLRCTLDRLDKREGQSSDRGTLIRVRMNLPEGKGERVPLGGQEARILVDETMGYCSGRGNLVLGKSKWCCK